MYDETPTDTGFGIRCLLGYNKLTGRYAVLSFVDDALIGQCEFDLYVAAVEFSNKQRDQVHAAVTEDAPAGTRVFMTDKTKLCAPELMQQYGIEEVTEQYILDTYNHNPSARPPGMTCRFFAVPERRAVFTLVVKLDVIGYHGIVLLRAPGDATAKKIDVDMPYQAKLAGTEDAAIEEAKMWLASELAAVDDAQASA